MFSGFGIAGGTASSGGSGGLSSPAARMVSMSRIMHSSKRVSRKMSRHPRRTACMEGEEGVDFRAVEPQPGQLVPWMLVIRIVKPVAALLPVPRDRRVEPLAQVFDIALEGGDRDAEFVQEILDRYHVPVTQHPLDFVEAFGAVHPSPSRLLLG